MLQSYFVKKNMRGYLCFSSFTMYREGCRGPSIRRRAMRAMQTAALNAKKGVIARSGKDALVTIHIRRG